MMLLAAEAVAENPAMPSIDLPNPYPPGVKFGELPAGHPWGGVIAIVPDRDGKSIWAFERCGGNCLSSDLPAVLEFDPGGKLVKSFGAGMFVFPHGIAVDKDDNVYVADANGKNGKGDVVVKFGPEGKALMTLGHPGMPGDAPGYFDRPSAVAVAPDGTIYVADGHGGDSSARIIKIAPDGKIIKTWGKKGSGPGEFNEPHGIALDSTGRVLVADRVNSRIQIFDPDGNFLAEWKQFGRPSAVFIDKNDVIYVADRGQGRLHPRPGLSPRHPDRQRQGRDRQILHPAPQPEGRQVGRRRGRSRCRRQCVWRRECSAKACVNTPSSNRGPVVPTIP